MIDEGIKNGVYVLTIDRILEDLKLILSFLYHNSEEYKHY